MAHLDQWLVRTSKNQIMGPFPKDQICHMVKQGKLIAQDEVCQAGNYWFALHEHEEVVQQLGISSPSLTPNEDEATETQTQTAEFEDERTDPGLAEDWAPELSESGDEENAAVLSNRAFRSVQPKKSAELTPPIPVEIRRVPVQPVLQTVESPVHWKTLMIGSFVCAGFALLLVTKIIPISFIQAGIGRLFGQ